MQGTVAEKVVRLAGDFIAHPDYAARYVSDNVLHKQTPLDLMKPWFSYAAIDFLEKNLRPEMSVCEYGSGGSTIFFAKRIKSVFSIEDNSMWHQLVSERLKKLDIHNAEMVLFPFNFKNPAGFEKSAYMNAVPDRPFDIYVIDGSEEWDQVRPICFKHVEPRVRPGGMIIVDDSWRYSAELHKKNKAREHRVFRSVGPCRPGVTSTDVFFY